MISFSLTGKINAPPRRAASICFWPSKIAESFFDVGEAPVLAAEGRRADEPFVCGLQRLLALAMAFLRPARHAAMSALKSAAFKKNIPVGVCIAAWFDAGSATRNAKSSSNTMRARASNVAARRGKYQATRRRIVSPLLLLYTVSITHSG